MFFTQKLFERNWNNIFCHVHHTHTVKYIIINNNCYSIYYGIFCLLAQIVEILWVHGKLGWYQIDFHNHFNDNHDHKQLPKYSDNEWEENFTPIFILKVLFKPNHYQSTAPFYKEN